MQPSKPDPSPLPAAPTPPSPAGYAVTMMRPHLREVPAAAFPTGYGIRNLQPDEGPLWLAIERDAEEEFRQRFADNAFEREFGTDLDAVPQRCFVVVDGSGAGVGTISAWYYTYRQQEYGLIHWVAVRRAYQGLGLGRAMVSFALGQLARWHDRALLNTANRRLPAIALYLNFGFAPVLDAPEARDRWREVAARLDHPALREFT
ncbi:MAG: GNAT family N-acetyltransferase [Candidatus Latescibacterota bacterium]